MLAESEYLRLQLLPNGFDFQELPKFQSRLKWSFQVIWSITKLFRIPRRAIWHPFQDLGMKGRGYHISGGYRNPNIGYPDRARAEMDDFSTFLCRVSILRWKTRDSRVISSWMEKFKILLPTRWTILENRVFLALSAKVANYNTYWNFVASILRGLPLKYVGRSWSSEKLAKALTKK